MPCALGVLCASCTLCTSCVPLAHGALTACPLCAPCVPFPCYTLATVSPLSLSHHVTVLRRAEMRLVATRAAKKGEQLVAIPWGAVAAALGGARPVEQASELDSTKATAALPAAAAHPPGPVAAGEQAQGGASPWAPFIAALPSYGPLPTFSRTTYSQKSSTT